VKTPQPDGPIHSLAGFERVNIGAGQSKDVTLQIDPRAISSVDEKGNRSILEGKYTLTLAGAQPQEVDAKSEAAFTVTGRRFAEISEWTRGISSMASSPKGRITFENIRSLVPELSAPPDSTL